MMLTPWYVTGFCDGEAVFTYSRAGGTFGLYFSIKQKEDSRQLIEEIYKYFNYVGNLYIEKVSTSGYSKKSQTVVYYRVTKIDELKIIVGHFDKYPLQSPSKREVYSIWRDMVAYKLENYRKIDYDKLRGLAEKLSNQNKIKNQLPKAQGS